MSHVATHVMEFASRDILDAAQPGIHALPQDVAQMLWLPEAVLDPAPCGGSSLSRTSCTLSTLIVPRAQANEQLQVVRESHAATSKEVADAHRWAGLAAG